jgi:hypothetical protein
MLGSCSRGWELLVTNPEEPSSAVERFSDKRTEQGIDKVEQDVKMTRVSCNRLR